MQIELKPSMHEKASLLVRCFPKLKRGTYSYCLKLCHYIEEKKDFLFTLSPNFYSYFDSTFFISNKKIYILTKMKIGSGEAKTFYIGLDYFKLKLVAFCIIKLHKVNPTRKESALYTDKELIDRHLTLIENIKDEIMILNFLHLCPPGSHKPRGIVKLLESFKNEEKMILILKYYRGRDLASILKEIPPHVAHKIPSYKQKLQMAYDLISGLAHTHKHDITHDDIKENNILVDIKVTDTYRKKIQSVMCDYNLFTQKAMDDDENGDDLRKYKVGGSPLYYSPEKMEALINADWLTLLSFKEAKQSDVWALGCVLFRLFFDTPPWFSTLLDLNEEKGNQYFLDDKFYIASIIRNSLYNNFPKPENEHSIEHLVWQMLRPDGNVRILIEDALPLMKKLLPPMVPPLKLSENYPSNESLDTLDTADTSTTRDTASPDMSSRNSSRTLHKTNRVRTQRSKSASDSSKPIA